MSWPELQVEHLAVALLVSWLALAWFCWGCGLRLSPNNGRRDPVWNWLAGAALLGALQLVFWLGLIQLRLEEWPEWARTLLAAFTTAHGVTAALAAWAWTGRSLSRTGGWCVLLAADLLTTAFVSIAPFLSGAGWGLVALVFLFSKTVSLPMRIRLAFGMILAALAATEIVTPDLTGLALRLPSELPLQWGSQQLSTLALSALLALGASLTLWLIDHPRRWRYLLAGALLAACAFLLAWRSTEMRAAERSRIWTLVEHTAASLAPDVAALKLEPEDIDRPEYGSLVAKLSDVEKATNFPSHLWVWSVQGKTVVHVADTASLAVRSPSPRTPPGYRYSQLYNFVLRAARETCFESGPYFVAGELRVGMHVPLRSAGAGPPVAWVQLAMPYAFWRENFSDPRANAVIGLIFLSGLATLVLAGRSWLEGAQILHGQAVEAAASAKAKNEMAGLVSHELRTPLQVVLGHLELLAVGPLLPGTQRTLKIIEDQCRQLLELVNDTLDLCALESGQLPVRLVRFSPARLAETTVDELRPLADERGLDLKLELQPGLPPLVEADAARIRQILNNLLANAIKYTPIGEVRLSVGSEGIQPSRLVFTVSDTGPGLPATVLAHLGQPFQTGSSSQGTGLGLAVIRRLCNYFGGDFTAVNATGGGCLATVRLPAARAVEDAPMFGSLSPVANTPNDLEGMRIVFAEDNTLVREIVVTHLRSLGAEVEAFADGGAALFACRANPPDAVLLDLAMPGVDGRTAARALRNLAPASAKPKLIVGLSAEAISDDEVHAAGFDRFFLKPVKLAELAAVLAPGGPSARSTPNPPTRLKELFVREAPSQLSGLRSAVERKDRTEIIRLAHYLQNSAYALSDEPLRMACATLLQWAESAPGPITANEALRMVEIEIKRLIRANDIPG